MKYIDGSVYVGTFRNDKVCGQGQLTMSDRVYNGAWRQGQMHGFGELIQSNGICFLGHFKNGVIEGRGKLIQKDGSYYDGQWSNGVRSGMGIKYSSKTNKKRKESWYKGKFVRVVKDVKFK